jgi:hypothetical protein
MFVQAISAMREMFRLATMQDIAVKRFPELFSILLIALGCYVGTSPPINTPQYAKGKKDKSTFVPNRNAYKLTPARYGMLLIISVKLSSFPFVIKLSYSFTESLKVCNFWILKGSCYHVHVFSGTNLPIIKLQPLT